MKTHVTCALLQLTALFLIVSIASAQEIIRTVEYGFADNPPDTEFLVTTDGDSLMSERYYFHVVEESSKWPHAVEYCSSVTLLRRGRRHSASGSCVRTDEDGDHFQGIWWQDADNQGRGGLRYFSGTGKYEGLECEGTWQTTDRMANFSNRFVGRSEMTCSKM